MFRNIEECKRIYGLKGDIRCVLDLGLLRGTLPSLMFDHVAEAAFLTHGNVLCGKYHRPGHTETLLQSESSLDSSFKCNT